jgi:hypothetical protein
MTDGEGPGLGGEAEPAGKLVRGSSGSTSVLVDERGGRPTVALPPRGDTGPVFVLFPNSEG